MKTKKVFFTEAAYIAGMLLLAVGTAFMERADFGMSTVVAPAYLLYLKVSEFLPWFTFGTAEYCLQFVLIILLTLIVRKFRPMYLFSFVTAVIYGFMLDTMMKLVALIPFTGFAFSFVYYILGMLLCAMGVAFLFNTYISPEAYELIVKEISSEFNRDIGKTKTVYDITSCVLAIIMSFAFFGFMHFEGVKAGTVICAFINGWIISRCADLLNHVFEFRDRLKLRKFFS